MPLWDRTQHSLASQIIEAINDAEEQQEEAENLPASDLWELLKTIRTMARAIRDLTKN